MNLTSFTLTKSAVRPLTASNSGLRLIASSSNARTLSALKEQGGSKSLLPTSEPGMRGSTSTNDGATARHIVLGQSGTGAEVGDLPSGGSSVTRDERASSFAARRRGATLQ